jgi:hypothetical protein
VAIATALRDNLLSININDLLLTCSTLLPNTNFLFVEWVQASMLFLLLSIVQILIIIVEIAANNIRNTCSSSPLHQVLWQTSFE